MNADNLLPFIFQEHVGSASIVPFFSSITLEAMQLFGGYALQKPAYVALAGILTGCLLNWIFGFMLGEVSKLASFMQKATFPKAEQFFRDYGFLITAFYWLPLGTVLLVIAGFFRAPWWKVLIAVAVGGAFQLRHALAG